MNYKVEDLVLFNERKEIDPKVENYVYNIEKTLSEKEKIEFIDEHCFDISNRPNFATYMLGLIDKYQKEKDSLKKDSWGYVKTVSLKAWIKKNDTLHVIDDYFKYGHYYFCGKEFTSLSRTPAPLFGSSNPYFNQEGKIVDYWFHEVLNRLYKVEVEWYRDHNSTYQKVRQIEKYFKLYGDLGIRQFGFVGGNGIKVLDDKWLELFSENKPTEEELDQMLAAYKEVDAIMQTKTKEIQERLGWELLVIEEE